MYFDRLIDSYGGNFILDTGDGDFGKSGKKAHLASAIVFKIPPEGFRSATDYYKEGKQLEPYEAAYVRAPYQNVFFDCGKDFGFWVLFEDRGPNRAMIIVDFSWPGSVRAQATGDEMSRVSIMYIYPGQKQPYLLARLMGRETLSDFNPDNFGESGYAIAVVCTVMRLLIFMNCKNVIQEKIETSPRLQKKRARSNKRPLFDYYVLKVRQSFSGGSEKKDLWSNRIHLCRGHFKNYTDENPLFGKYTGLYWWQPHARGQKKKGVVVKDYDMQGVLGAPGDARI